MKRLSWAPLVCSLLLSILTESVIASLHDAMKHQRAHLERINRVNVNLAGPTSGMANRQDGSTISFANPAAEQFFVDGTTIPDGPSVPHLVHGTLLISVS